MKKLIYLATVLLTLSFISCQEETIEPRTKQIVPSTNTNGYDDGFTDGEASGYL